MKRPLGGARPTPRSSPKARQNNPQAIRFRSDSNFNGLLEHLVSQLLAQPDEGPLEAAGLLNHSRDNPAITDKFRNRLGDLAAHPDFAVSTLAQRLANDWSHTTCPPHPNEPAIEQVVVELLHQQPLGADREERLQQSRPQQPPGAIESRPVPAYSSSNSASRLARPALTMVRIARSGCRPAHVPRCSRTRTNPPTAGPSPASSSPCLRGADGIIRPAAVSNAEFQQPARDGPYIQAPRPLRSNSRLAACRWRAG